MLLMKISKASGRKTSVSCELQTYARGGGGVSQIKETRKPIRNLEMDP